MSCIYKYKGNTYTASEMEQYVKNNLSEFEGTKFQLGVSAAGLGQQVGPDGMPIGDSSGIDLAFDEAAIGSSKLDRIIRDARGVIYKMKKIYQKRAESKDPEAHKQALDKLTQLEDALVGSNKVAAIEQFIERAHSSTQAALNVMGDIRTAVKNKTASKESIQQLVELYNYMGSYKILDDMETALRRGEILLTGTKLTESEIIGKLREAIYKRDAVKEDYYEYGVPLLADWLLEHNDTSAINAKIDKEYTQRKEKLTASGLTGDKLKAKLHKLDLERDSFRMTRAKLIQELKRSSKDISAFNLLLDPAISSGDVAVEMFAKIIKDKYYEANQKDLAFENEMGRAFEEYKQGRSTNNVADLFDPLIETVRAWKRYKDENGHIRGKIVEEKRYVDKINWDAFNMSKAEMLQKQEKTKYKDQKKDQERNWFRDNTVVKSDAAAIIEQRRLELNDVEYKQWTDRNLFMKAGNIIGYKGELVTADPVKYHNPKWDQLQADPAAAKFHEFVTKTHLEAQEKLPKRERIGMRLPGVRKGDLDRAIEQGVGSALKDKAQGAIKIQEGSDTEFALVDQTGDDYKTVPIRYTGALELADQSLDVVSNMLLFNQMVNKYDAYSEIHAEVNLMKDVIGNRETVKTNSLGQQVKDAVLKKINPNATQNQQGESKAYQRLISFIDMAYYGEDQKREQFSILGKTFSTAKIANTIGSYTSSVSLIGNFLGSIANVTYGNAMIFAESMAKQYFSGASYARGKQIYYTHLGEMVADFGKMHDKSKPTLLIEHFDAMQGSFRSNYGHNVTGSVAKKLFSSDTLFWTQNKGEHEMQSSTLFMILDHTKVKDKDGNEISLWDAYEAKDGKLVIKPGVEFGSKQETELRNKLHAINRSLHGNYSDIDKSSIQQFAIGRLALLFRKFVRTGFRRRWRATAVDMEMGDMTEGAYYTFLRLMADDIRNAGWNVIFNQSTLSDLEKANVRRTIAEAGLFSLTVFGLLLLGYGDDDEEGKRSGAHNFLIYQARRLQAELSFYWNPIEAFRIIKTPSASMTTFERVGRFVDQLVFTWDPDKLEYKRDSGVNEKGDNKSWAYFKKLIPVVAGVEKSLSPEEAIKFFNQ